MTKVLYRYESDRYYEDVTLVCVEYKIIATTPCGDWVSRSWRKDRWVNRSARKRFAYPTKSEALKAYRHRKRSYVAHAQAALQRAKEDLALLDIRVETDVFAGLR